MITRRKRILKRLLYLTRLGLTVLKGDMVSCFSSLLTAFSAYYHPQGRNLRNSHSAVGIIRAHNPGMG